VHHENAAHDGRNCSTVPVNPAQLWSVTLSGAASYPVIAGGRVFVTTSVPGGSYGGSLYALDAQTGTILWGPVALSGTYFYFPLAYGGGRVFVNDFDGTLRAFNAATGVQEWSTTTSYFSGEPVVSQGEVWVQGYDHAARDPRWRGPYSGDPSDIGIGNNVLVVPTGSTVTAFG
jgi:PQQ-like domain